MRPLIILIPFLVAVANGKPGGSYSYPAPTPSAPPALLSNLGAPSSTISSPLFNLPTPTASVTPQIFNLPPPTASLAPSLLNVPAPTPSIAPSLLVDNVLSAGQYGSPLSPSVFNVGAQQPLGSQLQSFGIQSLDAQSLGLGLPFTSQGFGFDQSGFNFGGQLLSFGTPQLPLGSPQLSLGSSQLSLGSPQLSLGSPQFSLGSPQFSLGSPQLSFGSPQLSVGSPLGTPSLSVTPAPSLGAPVGPVHIGSVNPTIPTPGIGVQRPIVQNTGGVVVQKHVYVHVAPDEPEETLPPRRIVFPPPRKHYRIIFVKAPTPPTPTAPIVPPQVQDEERTLVYVLVKRPEQQPEINIRTAPPTVPSKPEVYFIRYDTRKESIASGSVASGPVPLEIGNRGAFVSEVGNDEPVRIGGSVLPTGVELNLNKASLSGGSALSLAVTGSPLDSTLQVSSTPVPRYGPPEHK